ncbi:MAG: alpha/beta hydrolase [Blastocatellia bacterium]|nr:alpha/beta hydrolase [Blastocatellia bacterium]
MNIEEWKAKGKRFNHKGSPIFYVTGGVGVTILLIHGFPTASWDWHKLWPALVQKFQCVAVDMIGFGFSAKPASYNYSIADQADIHEELLEKLNVKNFHIFAHDYGVTVAQELLARYEERKAEGYRTTIKSIMFLNGGLFPETHRPRLIQKLLASPIGGLVARLLSEKSFYQSFSEIFGEKTKPSEKELKEFWSLIEFNGGKFIVHKLMHYIAERRKFRSRWVGTMQKTTVPLRLVNGPVDPVSGLHMVEHYKTIIPNPDLLVLDEIGHYPQIENPEAVLQAFFDFIEKVESREN